MFRQINYNLLVEKICLHRFRGIASSRYATTHFGFKNVDEDEKVKQVHKVFTNVSLKYDLMNDAMSLGIHRIWKDYFVFKVNAQPNMKLLDVAGGTGDIAFRLSKRIKNGSITICDINQNMLDVGNDRALKDDSVDQNAENLPFENDTFDVYTIAFGIRNCTHIDKVLSEAFRVLKPNGQFLCLEFSHVSNPLLRSIYNLYSFQVIPVMGHILAGDWHSYQYLVESIRQFPDQESFREMIIKAGFSGSCCDSLSGGTCAIHSAFKL